MGAMPRFPSVKAMLAMLVVGAGGISMGCPATTTATVTETTTTAASAPEATTAASATVAEVPPTTVASPFAPAPPGRRLLLVATASVQGYVEPCGCTGDPLGGVARLAALVEQGRAAWGDRVLFVDGGDLLFEKLTDTAAVDRCQAEARTSLLVSAYARAGLAATTRGPLDDVRGADTRDALLRHHGVPSVDNGLGVVLSRGGLQVLVVGIGDDDRDLAAARNTIDSNREAVDVVVVLAQRNAVGARALAEALRGVDVVLVGKAGETPSPPEQVGGAVIVQPGWQAQHVAAVEVVLDGRISKATPLPLDARQATAESRTKLLDVRIAELDKLLAQLPDGPGKQFQAQRRQRFVDERSATVGAALGPMAGAHIAARSIALRRGMAEEPTAFAALKAYEGAIPTLVTQCETGVVCPQPPPGTATFVGAETCRACHAEAWAFWQQAVTTVDVTSPTGVKSTHLSGHVRAMDTLVHIKRDKDRSCVGCHSAGFDEPGGACTTVDVVSRGLGGVQCESCHGAGGNHAGGLGDTQQIGREVPEARCRQCHLPPHIPSAADFVYEDRLLLILGPGHGAATAARLRAARSPTVTSPDTP
jgi:hypothetical protein